MLESNSLLLEYINKETSLLENPSRSGVAKGEPIGFSKAKEISILNSLWNHSVKMIAETSDVSYGVLRKWRTEEEYRARLTARIQEFSDIAMQRIFENCSKRATISAKMADAIEMGPEQFQGALDASLVQAKIFLLSFHDVQEYSEDLFINIFQKLNNLIGSYLGSEDFLMSVALFETARDLYVFRDPFAKTKERERLFELKAKLSYSLAKITINHPDPCIRNRANAGLTSLNKEEIMTIEY